MNRDELFTIHTDTCARALETMRKKNQDYAGGSDDPFANFKDSYVLGVKPEIGLLMRVLDKIKRIQSFSVKGELAVKDEPVDDAIEDIINYMILLKGLIKDGL